MPDKRLYELAVDLGEVLENHSLRLGLAESCTGGWLAKVMTDVPGSSAWFDAGVVSYSNEAKAQLLGVDTSTIQAFGAVSQATAREMAVGVIGHSPANASIAITGVAGPDGGSVEKPVGLVWFAWGLQQNENILLKSESHRFDGARDMVRYQAVEMAMVRMVSWLEEIL